MTFILLFLSTHLILLVHILDLTDSLRHRSHRAERAPASRLVESHHDQTDYRRCEHQAVEPVGELSDPNVRFREHVRRVRPFPRNLKRPEKRYRLFERMCAGRDKVRLDDNAREHRQKEDEEPVSKPPRRQEFWRGLVTA